MPLVMAGGRRRRRGRGWFLSRSGRVHSRSWHCASMAGSPAWAAWAAATTAAPFSATGGEPLRLQGVAGVLAGVAAEHEPVVGGGVLAVVALDEPAAADRHAAGSPGR